LLAFGKSISISGFTSLIPEMQESRVADTAAATANPATKLPLNLLILPPCRRLSAMVEKKVKKTTKECLQRTSGRGTYTPVIIAPHPYFFILRLPPRSAYRIFL
jgi:hypothetical protein